MNHLIANVNRIKSGYNAQKSCVCLVSSKKSIQILKLLQAYGFIASWYQKTPRKLSVLLKYVDNAPSIKSIDMISKPSNQIYLSFSECAKIQNTSGVLILETVIGILELKEAMRRQIGGNLVCFIR